MIHSGDRSPSGRAGAEKGLWQASEWVVESPQWVVECPQPHHGYRLKLQALELPASKHKKKYALDRSHFSI